MSPKAKQPGDKSILPRLIVVSAPSGAGKTTLCDLLMRDRKDIVQSVSVTTRSIRPGELDGKSYYFVSREQFQKKIDRGELVEWAEVHGELYGIPKDNVERLIKQGKHVLFNIDVQGAKSLLTHYGPRVLLIFIQPPSIAELKKRLVDRQGDTSHAIERRLQTAYNEIEWSKIFDYEITNDDLDHAYQQLKEIVWKECR